MPNSIGTILLLAVGVIIIAPNIQMPAVTRFAEGGGPIIPGKLFPFMFITIACGAISGFHSLISSGTTPKMIMSEKDICFIGFGAMLVEGFVATVALIAATILIPGDYFAINTNLSFDAIAALGFPVERVTEFSKIIGTDAASQAEALTFKIDALLVFIMAMLAIIVLIDMFYKFYRYLSGRVGAVEKEIDYRG